MAKKTAVEVMDEIVQEPTLDALMRRLTPLTDAEYVQLVARLREERPLYIAKEAARKERKDDDD
jgi:hypothetical protein